MGYVERGREMQVEVLDGCDLSWLHSFGRHTFAGWTWRQMVKKLGIARGGTICMVCSKRHVEGSGAWQKQGERQKQGKQNIQITRSSTACVQTILCMCHFT